MAIYVPNIGERKALRTILQNNALVLGLYKTQVVPDGNTIIDTLSELATGGGRGYAQKALANEIVEGSETAAKWFLYMNAQGKAEAQYGLAASPQEWEFNANDVADGATVYGVFGYIWVLPFDQGATEIKVGQTVKGATSGATGIVTEVVVISGTWAGSDAAGYLTIKTKTGTFQDDENILISGEVGTVASAPTAGGTGYAVGDILEINEGDGSKVVVTAVTGGVVDTVVLVTGGSGYTTGTGKATTAITGSGTGCTVNITALASTAYAVTNTGATADAHRHLLLVDAFSEGHAIDTTGMKVQYTPKINLSTA